MVVIDNEIDSRVLNSIPQTQETRNTFLLSFLSQFLGETFHNDDMNVDVYISRDSIVETAHHASKSESSTIAALNMPNIIAKAAKTNTDIPKNNSQKRRFRFSEMYELHVQMRYVGDIKLMIGRQGRRKSSGLSRQGQNRQEC